MPLLDYSASTRLRAAARLTGLGVLLVLVASACAAPTISAGSGAQSTPVADQDANSLSSSTDDGADAAGAIATRFTVAATGDFLIHGPVFRQALSDGGGSYDFRHMFRYIRPYIRGADLAICHFETPMAPGPPASYPSFNTPRELAKGAEAVGWDVCDTASNHTLDKGQTGVDATLNAVAEAGLKSHGSSKDAIEAQEIPIVDVKGVKVAFLAYTESTNGIPLPNSWSVNLLDPIQIKSDAKRAKDAGAQVVIVNLHWGAEYQNTPSDLQNQVARQLTDSPDIDAIIGQHVHVVQPITWMNGKPVVYGEGNLVSDQSSACCPEGSRDGIIAELNFVVDDEKVRVENVNYVPVMVRRTDYAVIPIGVGLKKGLMDSGTLQTSYDRTVGVIGSSKRVKPVPATIR